MMKQEFEALLGASATMEEYRVVEYCYMNSDDLFPATDKGKVAELYRLHGINFFRALMRTIEVAKSHTKDGVIRYCETDFASYEQPVLDQLRKEGKYIYTLHDADDGNGYVIRKSGYCNRFGFMVTDKPLPLIEDMYLNDDDFAKLPGIEYDTSVLDLEVDVLKEVATLRERNRCYEIITDELNRLSLNLTLKRAVMERIRKQIKEVD